MYASFAVPKIRSLLAACLLSGTAAAQAVPAGLSDAAVAADLSAARAASPRPSECSPDGVGRTLWTHWERARRPQVARYCDALALGYAELGATPQRALATAKRAATLAPGRAAPVVLEARALVGAGRAREAFTVFARARAIDKRGLADPAALHDLAIAALASGEHLEAVAAYRALVPRAGMLADARVRQRVYLEAAMTVMRRDPKALDEALGYLGEARRLRGLPGLSDVVLGATALTLDRQGRHEEARGVAAEARGPLGVAGLATAPAAAGGPLVTLPDGELAAIAAVLTERTHPELAKKLWRTFEASAANAGSPWQAQAKRRAESQAAPVRRWGRPPR